MKSKKDVKVEGSKEIELEIPDAIEGYFDVISGKVFDGEKPGEKSSAIETPAGNSEPADSDGDELEDVVKPVTKRKRPEAPPAGEAGAGSPAGEQK